MSVLWHESGLKPTISERLLRRHLRVPASRSFTESVGQGISAARDWFAANGRCWSCAWRADETFAAKFAARVSDTANITIVAVSAGPEAEIEANASWRAGEPDRYYFLECLASAVVETLMESARARLGVSRHFCPGYPGWPISENADLLAALRSAGALAGPLDVLESGMLTPKKSQIAVCAVERVFPYP